MAMVMAFENAKSRQFRVEGDGVDISGGVSTTPFFGAMERKERDRHNNPQAFLSQTDKGRTARAHFHALDQFQVLVDGGVKIGRHEMSAYSVHFARAYTPYGPLIADAGSGMTQFVLRPFHDPLGPQRIPDKQSILQSIPDRRPWQVYVSGIAFPGLPEATAAAQSRLEAIAGLNVGGVTAYALSMAPNAIATAPDPAGANGQYVVAVKGSLIHDDQAHPAATLVYVSPDEKPLQIHAGPEGLQALVLGFPPVLHDRSAGVARTNAGNGEAWRCVMCAYVYDPAKGLPSEAIAPGTRWTVVPDNWTCPNCSSTKALFNKVR